LLLALVLPVSRVAAERLVILHVNDTHTQFLPSDPSGTIGGVARAATLIEQVRAEEENVLLFDGGDWSEGTFFHPIAAPGALELRLRDVLGFDAVTIGNHDYLYSIDYLESKIMTEQPSVPLLAANMLLQGTEYEHLTEFIKPWVIVERGGTRIGIFGVTDTLIAYTQFAEPVELESYIQAAERCVSELQDQGVDLIIALNHLGFDTDMDLALDVPGIDIIVGGHSHTRLSEVETVYNEEADWTTYIVQAGDWWRFVGRLVVDYDATTDSVSVVEYELMPVDLSLPPDPAVQEIIDEARAEITETYGDVWNDHIADSEIAFVPGNWECPFGNLVTDVMADAGREAGIAFDFAAMSNNFMAETLPAGRVDTIDVYRAFPYGYDPELDQHLRLARVGMLGQWWATALPMFKALGFVVNLSGAEAVFEGSNLISFKIGGQEFDPQETYYALLNNTEVTTLLSVGLPAVDPEEYEIEIWPLLRDRLSELSPVSAADVPIEGRIRSQGPDLTLQPHDIRFSPEYAEPGDTVTISITVYNHGINASAGGTLEVYHEATPLQWQDDPNYGESTLIQALEIGGIDGLDDSAEFDIEWDTSGLERGVYPIYVVLRDVQDPEGNPEDVTVNNRATSLSGTYALLGREGPLPPVINAAGFWNNRLQAGQPGTIQLLAWVSDPNGPQDILGVEVKLLGQSLGFMALDDGQHADLGPGDSIYGFTLDLPGGVGPGIYPGLELVATDREGLQSTPWPQLQIR
jgi:2',3'-cyclic-nucleotide 2'-phosphodiesterase (5'-nucleotidase family)